MKWNKKITYRLLAMKKNYNITFKNWGGFIKQPTPGGVPVKIKSPGNKVQNCEHQATTWFVLNTNCFVLEFCLVSPLTTHFKFKLCGSPISFVVVIQGPNGQNAFIDFPNSHCPPFFRNCQSLAETSWATVKPKMWSAALSSEMLNPDFPWV